jgi:hypothetical protein
LRGRRGKIRGRTGRKKGADNEFEDVSNLRMYRIGGFVEFLEKPRG